MNSDFIPCEVCGRILRFDEYIDHLYDHAPRSTYRGGSPWWSRVFDIIGSFLMSGSMPSIIDVLPAINIDATSDRNIDIATPSPMQGSSILHIGGSNDNNERIQLSGGHERHERHERRERREDGTRGGILRMIDIGELMRSQPFPFHSPLSNRMNTNDDRLVLPPALENTQVQDSISRGISRILQDVLTQELSTLGHDQNGNENNRGFIQFVLEIMDESPEEEDGGVHHMSLTDIERKTVLIDPSNLDERSASVLTRKISNEPDAVCPICYQSFFDKTDTKSSASSLPSSSNHNACQASEEEEDTKRVSKRGVKIPSRTLRSTVCDHLFCKDCIEQWFERSTKCPMCMLDLSDQRID